MINTNVVSAQVRSLMNAGFTKEQAVQLVIADWQADSGNRLADAVRRVADVLDRKKF